MTQRYPGGFVTKTPPTLNPALGNSTPGVWTLDQVMQNIKAGTWPAYDPYFEYTTLLLHGNGTNGAQNNTFLDSSTNNFTITRNGNTTQGTFTPYGPNWSNYFDGSGDYLTATKNAAYEIGSGDFTVEAWIFPTAGGALYNSGILSYGASSSLNGWLFGITGSNVGGTLNRVMFEYNYDGTLYLSTSAVTLNAWNHVAVSRSGSNIYVFLNGVLQSTTSTTKTANTNAGDVSVIGSESYSPSDGNRIYTGYISNLRLVKGTAVYTASFTPSTSPLTAITNTSLLTCQSNRFIDNSSNAFAITVNGSPSVQRFSPFNPSAPYDAGTIGGSGYFDGSGDYLSVADNAAFDFGSGDFTIECWAYTDTFASQYNVLVCQWNTSYSFIFRITSSLVGLYINVGNPYTLQDYSASVTNTTGQWNHFCVTRSGSTLTFYKNGSSIGTSSISATITNAASDLTVGVLGDLNSTTYHKGYISGMRLIKGTAVAPTITTPPTAVSGTSLLLNMTNGGIIDNAMMNDLETVGNAQISTTQSKFGGASLAFDGTGDYLTTPNAVQFNASAGNWTIEAWVNFSSNTVSQPLIVGNPRNFYFVYVYETSQTKLILGDGSINPILVVISPPSAGTWWHMCCVKNGSTYTVYQNGVAQASTTTSLSNTTLNGFYIGHDPGGATYFNGYIDDFRITKGYARYTANFTPQTSQWQDQ